MNINWIGQSGQSYAFETHPIGTQFVAFPGVYIFCSSANGTSWAAQYVGETGDFSERLNRCVTTHHAFARARSFGATHVGVLRVFGLGQQRRLEIETDLRRGLRPPANNQ